MKTFIAYLQEQIDGGNCFSVANSLILGDGVPIKGTELNQYKIVHAMVYGEGALAGRRFVHAFMLYDDKLVIDNSIDFVRLDNALFSLKL